jgi:hypothetical protein
VIDTTTSNAEELAVLLPGAHVVKAFNTLLASNQVNPAAATSPFDGFVAGDDEAAKATVLALVESVGLNPIDVGPLSRARQLEGMAFLNITLNIANGGTWQSGWKLVDAPVPAKAACPGTPSRGAGPARRAAPGRPVRGRADRLGAPRAGPGPGRTRTSRSRSSRTSPRPARSCG